MSAADDNNKKKKQTSNIGWILSLTKEEKLPLTVGITGMTIASAMNVVFPRIMGKAIDVASGKPGSAARLRGGGARHLLHGIGGLLPAHELAFYNNRKVGELAIRLSGECQQTANAVVDVLSNGYRSLNSAVESPP
ncbi:hypothetical protein PR003_g27552 [Phytophthora rubi]|uniref:ABC transmembrane type-1 domain-containing protein n=1 Tax=Phytophthora rubi TaxID=129364 RepID=A0A6A4C0W6_9STRA|nr:hypothetical protein PR003_g27552 [Phytophthora rubi]